MTNDLAAALSLMDGLSRVGLTDRLRQADPELLDRAARGRPDADRVIQRAARLGIGFVGWNDPAFPPQLLQLTDAPPGLWYRGDIARLAATRIVAIVGARAASAVSLEAAAQIAAGLSAHGVLVVSGLARGVDSAAHTGALRRGGRTAAVLGSGLARIYPSEHTLLAEEVVQNGVVVSEYGPEVPPLPFHFPARNRIISGLSSAVVVVEASEKSGSLITATCALEQGRGVFVVPGCVLSGRNRGSHALLRDGAALAESADDVLAELGWAVAPPPGQSAPQSEGTGAAPSGTGLLATMEAGSIYELDELASETGIDAGSLLSELTRLELDGSVRRLEGSRFVRASRTC